MKQKYYKKDDLIRAFPCDDQGRVMATVEVQGRWTANPSIDTLLADGWEEVEMPQTQEDE